MSCARITKLFHNFFASRGKLWVCLSFSFCISLNFVLHLSLSLGLSFSSFLTCRLTLYLLQPIFLLSSACPTRLSHFSINEKAGLQDFSNKFTCSVWSSTQLIITSYVYVYIYIYIYFFFLIGTSYV